MILVDTSVWVQHFRSGESALFDLLVEGRVVMHPFVIGELALGSLAQREQTIGDLCALPSIAMVEAEEILAFIAARQLFNLGLGYVDVNLLASALLAETVRLWTLDRRLCEAAKKLGVQHMAR